MASLLLATSYCESRECCQRRHRHPQPASPQPWMLDLYGIVLPRHLLALVSPAQRKHQVQRRSPLQVIFGGCLVIRPIPMDTRQFRHHPSYICVNYCHSRQRRTFACPQRSNVAAPVEYPPSLPHAPLFERPSHDPPSATIGGWKLSVAKPRSLGKRRTLLSGSISSSISFPVRVRTLGGRLVKEITGVGGSHYLMFILIRGNVEGRGYVRRTLCKVIC